MSTLPLTLADQLVTINQLAGSNYVPGYPELLNLLGQHPRKLLVGATVIASNAYIYPIPGKQRVWAVKGKGWTSGMRLRAYKAGNLTHYCTILVNDYSAATGQMIFEVLAASYFDLAQPSAYFFTPFFPESAASAVLSTASGGTAGNDIESARVGLKLPCNSKFTELFADFVVPLNICRRIVRRPTLFDNGAAVALPLATNPYDYQNHPGVARVGTGTPTGPISAVGDYDGVVLGRPSGHDWADWGADGTVFEAQINLPALITDSKSQVEVGLVGTNAKLLVCYTNGVNTGRFTFQTGVSGSYTTQNTVLTVAAATWYKIRLETVGANIQVQINGANTLTVAKAGFQGLSGNNRMSPLTRMIAIVSSPAQVAIDIDYLYFLREFPTAR